MGNDILDSPVLAPEELHVYSQTFHTNVLAPLGATCGLLQITWRSAGALPAPRIQSYKHTAPPELGQVSQVYCYR